MAGCTDHEILFLRMTRIPSVVDLLLYPDFPVIARPCGSARMHPFAAVIAFKHNSHRASRRDQRAGSQFLFYSFGLAAACCCGKYLLHMSRLLISRSFRSHCLLWNMLHPSKPQEGILNQPRNYYASEYRKERNRRAGIYFSELQSWVPSPWHPYHSYMH